MNPQKTKYESGRFWYLLFWPVFGLRYLLLEQYHPVGGYHPVFCGLDEKIPFLEWFVIPYFLWHFVLIGLHLWLYFYDERVFRQYSCYLIVTISASTLIFLVWPSCQNLRPEQFPRDNLLTAVVGQLYRLDTSTNVCPSEHVIGAVGFAGAAKCCEKMKPSWRMTIVWTAVLSSAATVFLKQHSILDVAAALPICLTGYWAAFAQRRFCRIRLAPGSAMPDT